MKYRSKSRSQSRSLGRYLSEISIFPLLTQQEEICLGEQIRNGDPMAVQRLVESNLRFVVAVAKRYRGLGVSFQDLIHEGNLGLIEAARRFDPERKVRFISYAVWWIRHSIICAISSLSTPFRLPVRAKRKCYRLGLAIRKCQETQAPPTVEELSLDLNLRPEEVLHILQIRREPLSLSQPASPTGDQTIEESIGSDSNASLDRDLVCQDRNRILHALMQKLTPRERIVLQWRYGLQSEETRSLQDIGERVGLSRERIRQIHAKALSKLRRIPRLREMENFSRT